MINWNYNKAKLTLKDNEFSRIFRKFTWEKYNNIFGRRRL